MYNYSDTKFLNSRNISAFSLAPKKFNPYMRNGFYMNNTINHLPAIKEEEIIDSEEESEINSDILKEVKSYTSLPPLNINCLMNIDIKQSQFIWNTNFAKRLLNETDDSDSVSGRESFVEEFFLDNKGNESKVKKLGNDKKSSKKTHPKKSFMKAKVVRERNAGKNKEDKTDQIENSKKKPKRNIKQNQNLAKKTTTQEKKIEKTTDKKNSVEKLPNISKSVSIHENVSTSTISQPQQCLSEYVRNLIGNFPDEHKCEHCKETFSDIEELCKHQREHENEKETCLLCEKVFYNPNEFVQHLLTHEGVDRYSCKKCMMYFPNSRKLKEHNKEYHFKPVPSITYISPFKSELVEKWLPKFECKRCKLEFDSSDDKEAHRKAHLKKDLTMAYLLNQKTI